ncbi:MAG: hypothetical protein ACFHVJ_05260 [Aestuariibacter sp.]
MLKLTKTVFFVSALVLSGCASMDPTPYQMASDKGEFGYTHKKLTDNQYRVSFRGNRKTDKDTIRDYALLHAADLTLEQGYDWFYISNQDMETNSKSVPSTRGGVSVTTSSSTSCGLLGCTTVHHPQYTGTIVESEERTQDHVNTLNITMGKGQPENPNSVYDARALAKNIRSTI